MNRTQSIAPAENLTPAICATLAFTAGYFISLFGLMIEASYTETGIHTHGELVIPIFSFYLASIAWFLAQQKKSIAGFIFCIFGIPALVITGILLHEHLAVPEGLHNWIIKEKLLCGFGLFLAVVAITAGKIQKSSRPAECECYECIHIEAETN